MSIFVAGNITDDVQRDIRQLYLLHNPVMQSISVVAAVGFLVAASYPSPSIDLFMRVAAVALGGLFLYRAFFLFPLWWRQYWPQMRQDLTSFAPRRVDAVGIEWGEPGNVIKWSSLIGAKMNDQVVLTYVTQSYPLPFHRAMFSDEVDWQTFLRLVQSSGVAVRKYRYSQVERSVK